MKNCRRCTPEDCLCAQGNEPDFWQARIGPEMTRHGESLCDALAMGWHLGEWVVRTRTRLYFPDRDINKSEPLLEDL